MLFNLLLLVVFALGGLFAAMVGLVLLLAYIGSINDNERQLFSDAEAAAQSPLFIKSEVAAIRKPRTFEAEHGIHHPAH